MYRWSSIGTKLRRSNFKFSKRSISNNKISNDAKTKPIKESEEELKVEPLTKPSELKVFFNGPLRCIAPYWTNAQTFVKKRWIDMPIKEVFAKEFPIHAEDLEQSFNEGKIRLDNHFVTPNKKVQHGQTISLVYHQHELPISYDPQKSIKIIEQNDDVLVVAKGHSIPIHPSGRFHFNTLTWLLTTEFGYPHKSLRNINRIDRYTSGIVILAKTPQVASKLTEEIRNSKVDKFYVARVRGKFPKEDLTVDKGILFEKNNGFKLECSDDGKQAITKFKFLGYSPAKDESLVLCQPITGRTHQIRLHLKFLGFPISNDPEYANLPVRYFPEYHISDKDDSRLVPHSCHRCRNEQFLKAHDASLYLHALKYVGSNWEFSTPMPEWASF